MPFRMKHSRPGRYVGLFDQRIEAPGVPLGVKEDKASLSPAEGHCLIDGSTGRGKTRRVIYPSVVLAARSGQSIIVIDPKGEIFKNTADEIRKCGLDIRVLNLRNPMYGDRWSPLALVEKNWKSGNKAVAATLLKDVADIITQKISYSKDAYWHEAAMDTFLGFSLLCLEHEKRLTFDNVFSLVNEFLADKDSRNEFKENLNMDADSYRKICTLANLESDTTASCIVSELSCMVSSFADREDVRDLLAESDYDVSEIGRRPTAFFVIIPDESTALHPIAGLFISQTYSELVRYADSREDNRLPVGVTYIIDEFGSIPGTGWPEKLTAGRSRGIRFVLAIQTIDQLAFRFGEHGSKTILSNCRTVIFLGGQDIWMINLLSSFSPTLTFRDMVSLKKGDIVVMNDGEVFKSYLPDWEAWGVRIRTELYFAKREALKRDVLHLSDFCEEMFTLADFKKLLEMKNKIKGESSQEDDLSEDLPF